MRRKHITSHYKLPVLTFVLLTSLIVKAKEEEKDTEIICFAAQNKWICAPADQQDLAKQKAQKLLEKNKTELDSSKVVIKTINIPKFDTQVVQETKDTSSEKTPVVNKPIEKKIVADLIIKKPTVNSINDNVNPYANLWSHQLIGLSTPNSAIKFVKNNNLDKNDVLIIQSTRANMDWWIVLYGLYADKQTGLDNAVNLPKNMNNTWLRPLKNLVVNGFVEKF
jgi:septal ring-binding cell division protein DamX